MAYVANITSRAERDLAHLYSKINAEYSDLALKWYRGLKEAILMRGFGPNESLFGGPVLSQLSQPTPIEKLPGSLQNQKTMPLPGAPTMPPNPFPELGRRLLRWNGF